MSGANSITSANSILSLGVASLFPVAEQMQGFAQDDAYSMENVEVAETQLGVDGILSAGWIPQTKTMNIVLQADSDSVAFFEEWYAQQEAVREIFKAFGSLRQDAVGRRYILSNGVLLGYSPAADAKKVLQPRRFQIRWQVALGAPI